jgi:hypothetical protein
LKSTFYSLTFIDYHQAPCYNFSIEIKPLTLTSTGAVMPSTRYRTRTAESEKEPALRPRVQESEDSHSKEVIAPPAHNLRNPRTMTASNLLALQNTSGNRAVMRLIQQNRTGQAAPQRGTSATGVIQRNGGSAVSEAEEVDETPLPGQVPVTPEQEQQAQAAASELVEDRPYVVGNPALAEVDLRVMQAEDAQNPVPPEPAPAPPQRSFKQRVKDFFGMGKGKYDTAKDVRNKTFTAAKLSGVGVAGAATLGGRVASSVASAVPVANIATAGVQTALDWHAFLNATAQSNELGSLSNTTGGGPLKQALTDAAAQKGRKANRRFVSAIGGAIGIAGAALLLASNPVGWAVSAALIGIGAAVAIGTFAHRIGRFLYKKFWKKNQGQHREKIATILFNALQGEYAGVTADVAAKAITELHLQPDKIKQLPARKAIEVISRKLKSY